MSNRVLTELSDLELVKLMRKDNELAFDQLYHRYWELLFSIAYHKTGSQEDTEDLVHEVFLDLWKNRYKIEIRSSFAAYVATALKYKVFRMIESKGVRKKHVESVRHHDHSSETTTQDYLSFQELYDLIEQAVDSLPDRCQSVFRLSRDEDYSIKEIAEQLNISPNTAKNHIKAALKHLRLDLQDYLSVLLIFYCL